MGRDESQDILLQESLKSLGLSLLSDWDVLIFLYRHQTSLASAGRIAHLLGYSSRVVGESLDRLEKLNLAHRSRPSRGVRLYQCRLSDAHLTPGSSFRWLMDLAETRSGRLLLLKHLRKNVGLHLAAKGQST